MENSEVEGETATLYVSLELIVFGGSPSTPCHESTIETPLTSCAYRYIEEVRMGYVFFQSHNCV